MNDDDMSIVIGHGAAADTITISADDLSTIDLSDIKINTAVAQPGPWSSGATLDFFKAHDSKPKTSTVYDLDIDPLAAIIELKAGGQFPDIELIKRHVPNKDTVDLAQSIREYFLDKVITQKLSGQFRDSDFKRDMVKALKLSSKCVLEEPHIRLLYRMDDFYKEDTFKDRIATEYVTLPDLSVLELNNTPVSYIGSIDVFRRGGKTKQFYFKTKNNYVIVLKSPKGDWLVPVTAVFRHVKELWISGNARPSKVREHEFHVAELNNKYTVDNFVF